MKKKIIVISAILFTIVFVVISIKTIKIERVDVNNSDLVVKQASSEEVLMQVLKAEKEFIDPTLKEILITSLTIEDSPVKINQYCFVDLDGDNESELLGVTDSYYGYYLVLNIENNIIYGYIVNKNDMDYINNKGIVLNNVDSSTFYERFEFDKGTYKKAVLASSENNIFIINKEEVLEEDFRKYEDEFVSSGLIQYKSLNTNWMEKRINSDYSLKLKKTYQVNMESKDFIFGLDSEFDNFKDIILDESKNVIYMDSNENSGKMLVKMSDENYDKFISDIAFKKSVGIYDEISQYIAIIINNDKLSSSLDNNYDIYYFKYYNKGFQYLGSHVKSDFYEIFDEDIISELE